MSWQMPQRERETAFNAAVYFLIDKEVLKPYFYACQLLTNIDRVVC